MIYGPTQYKLERRGIIPLVNLFRLMITGKVTRILSVLAKKIGQQLRSATCSESYFNLPSEHEGQWLLSSKQTGAQLCCSEVSLFVYAEVCRAVQYTTVGCLTGPVHRSRRPRASARTFIAYASRRSTDSQHAEYSMMSTIYVSCWGLLTRPTASSVVIGLQKYRATKHRAANRDEIFS